MIQPKSGSYVMGAIFAASLLLSGCRGIFPWSAGYADKTTTKSSPTTQTQQAPATAPSATPSASPSSSPSARPSGSPSPSPSASPDPFTAQCPAGSYSATIRLFPDGRKAEVGCYTQAPDGSISPEGTWVAFHTNGSMQAVKRFHLGVAQGAWKRWDPNGQTVYVATFEKGAPVGTANVRRDAGDAFSLNFRNAGDVVPSSLTYKKGDLQLTVTQDPSKKSTTIELLLKETTPGKGNSTVYSGARASGKDTVVAGNPSAFFAALPDEWLVRFAREAKGFGVPLDSGISDADGADLVRKLLANKTIDPDAATANATFVDFIGAAAVREIMPESATAPAEQPESE